ncbi:hypothetical protein CDAR_5391 [Caerostris darwini]|uniref:Uncharacterized protein n=1 Tax=Caerostris darwini TaxID=1538125 RepID=A0AAV4R8A8_9ARAC|nr:hypothetical protein CDAR_5391 [Caerostris darwini]
MKLAAIMMRDSLMGMIKFKGIRFNKCGGPGGHYTTGAIARWNGLGIPYPTYELKCTAASLYWNHRSCILINICHPRNPLYIKETYAISH